MDNLKVTKKLILTLTFILSKSISIYCQTINSGTKDFTSYGNPFVPIYCEDDNLSFAISKPDKIYKILSGSEIIIPNMPAYKTQSELGECRAFALATLLQHYTCEKWKSDIPDCKNPPQDMAISYFGLLIYTNRTVEEDYTFVPNQIKNRKMFDIIKDLSNSGNRLILENCKPFEKLVESFSTTGTIGMKRCVDFLDYLKFIYDSKKNVNISSIENCDECIKKINNIAGLNITEESFKKSLNKNTFEKFMYVLFFDNCKRENFPAGFWAAGYPDDTIDASEDDIKRVIIKGLSMGKPIMLPSLCISMNTTLECSGVHAIVIAGYKKVYNKSSNTYKEVFKLHNSWGEQWQKTNNDGWVDADIVISNLTKVNVNNRYKIASDSVIWLMP